MLRLSLKKQSDQEYILLWIPSLAIINTNVYQTFSITSVLILNSNFFLFILHVQEWQSNFCQERTLIKSLLKSKCFFVSNSEQSSWNHVLQNLNSFPNMNHMNFCEKETKNEVCCCCFSWSWRRMFFQSNFELVFMALGHILPDLILGNCVQKCISWILPIISNEPFMTQDELRTWKIILRALQILPTLKSLISMEFFLFFLRKFSQLHRVLGLCVFLGLAKICKNQICSTQVISNQKCMSVGIPSLM